MMIPPSSSPLAWDLKGAAHFLDPEDDAGQRCVERRRDAGRGAGQDQPALAAGREPTDGEHDGGANLHGRALTTGSRRSQSSPEHCQQHSLPRADADRHQPPPRRLILQMPGGDRLRDTAALGVWEIAPGQPRRQAQAERRHHQRRKGPAADQARELFLSEIGQQRKYDGRDADHDPTDKEDQTPLRSSGMQTEAAAQQPSVSHGVSTS